VTGAHNHELSLSVVQELVSDSVKDRDAVRWRGKGISHGDFSKRTRRLANAFLQHGLGGVVERSRLRRWEAGQDFVGVLMKNRPEFLEAMFGAFKARCVPFNINYRYGAHELRQILGGPAIRALVYEVDFAEVVRTIRDDLPPDLFLIEVGGTEESLVPGALSYEQMLQSSHDLSPRVETSADDLYVVLTGGTTGDPKAVLWRQADIFVAALGGPEVTPDKTQTIERLVLGQIKEPSRITLPAPPFMHGAGQWVALANLLNGNTVVIQDVVDRLDPVDLWTCVARERVGLLMFTGNAYALPLLEELIASGSDYDLSRLRFIITGGVAMTLSVKRRLMAELPHIQILETVGASESGTNLSNMSAPGETPSRTFRATQHTFVLSEDRTAPLQLGHTGSGWLARIGRVPLGYMDDPERSDSVFPIIDGVRHSVPGDRARLLASGQIELLGRDAVTINSGGEKVFGEEVERALASHPSVYDVIVIGRPHDRWGQEIVALVQLTVGATVTTELLQDHVASQLARYKVPRSVYFVEAIQRNQVGKPNYVWALETAIRLA
jgi:fatty-acyl-CoA synthase